MTHFIDQTRRETANRKGLRPVVSTVVGWIADQERSFRDAQAKISDYDRGGFRG